MALDLNDGYKVIQEKVSATQKYKNIKKDADDLKKRNGESLETAKKLSTQQLSNLKDKRDKFKKDLNDSKKTQFDQLLDLTKLLSKGGEKSGQTKTTKYLKKVFVTAITELKPQIKDILNDLGTSAIGCAQDQTYIGNQSIYIKVKSFDLVNFLKEDPESSVGKITYEKESIQYGTFPFSLNKSLYNRMQNINQPYSIPATLNYVGTSGQELFDITYVESYVDPIVGLVQGNFYKIDLKNRESNKIVEFLEDYYSTIDIVDFKNIFANLINQLTGAISIKKGDGDINLGDLTKVLLILKRILGLCFDSTTEIDVGGVSKVSEFDNIAITKDFGNSLRKSKSILILSGKNPLVIVSVIFAASFIVLLLFLPST